MTVESSNTEAGPMPLGDTAQGLLAGLWKACGGRPEALGAVQLTGQPVLPSVFRVGDIASATTAATGLAAAEVHRIRTGQEQTVRVDMRHAEVAFLSDRYLQVSREWPDHQSPTWGYYETRDGRWIQIHTTFPHHQDGAAQLLDCPITREDFQAAVATWDGVDIEDAMAGNGVPCTMMRPHDEWLAHPQGAALSKLPLIELIKIGDAPPLECAEGARPLSGLRVLDLTRVIAGPICGRNLAEHGAEVMRIASPNLPYVPRLVIDSGRGKLSAHLDLKTSADCTRLETLLESAHVFVQGYRPGAVDGLGFTPEAVAARRPGIIYTSLCAFSHAGPWSGRRGFDSLVQVASGIAQAGADAAGKRLPVPLPCQALDHATGYLAALGTMMARTRQMTEGGSWHVRVSLAQTSHWLQQLGPVAGLGLTTPELADIADLMDEADTPFGQTQFVRPVAQLSSTPAYWASPPVPLGTHPPQWTI